MLLKFVASELFEIERNAHLFEVKLKTHFYYNTINSILLIYWRNVCKNFIIQNIITVESASKTNIWLKFSKNEKWSFLNQTSLLVVNAEDCPLFKYFSEIIYTNLLSFCAWKYLHAIENVKFLCIINLVSYYRSSIFLIYRICSHLKFMVCRKVERKHLQFIRLPLNSVLSSCFLFIVVSCVGLTNDDV